MGFGVLFLGYLLFFPAFLTFFYTVPLAALMTACACYRLARVNRPFGLAFYASCALIPVSGAAIVLRLVDMTEAYAHYAEAACLALLLVWNLLILTGIDWVARETGLTKMSVKALRNKIFTCIYYVPAVLLTLSDGLAASETVQVVLSSLSIAMLLVGFVVLCLNAILIYSAYMHICMPEDLHMPRKPSRFAFVNRYREKIDQREAEEQAALLANAKAKQTSAKRKKKK
jgi:hypothetical protein